MSFFEKVDVLKEQIGNISIDKIAIKKYEEYFDIAFTYNSCAIEGNTYSLLETKILLEERVTIGGKQLREQYEIINHDEAYKYVKKCIKENKDLTENMLKDIHEILVQNIFQGGVYRNTEVRISGVEHIPPTPSEAFYQMKKMFLDYEIFKKEKHPIELAAYMHAEFTRIHPFIDGNGRTARLLMNYILLKNSYLPIIIEKENKLEYIKCLDEYSVRGDLNMFVRFLCEREEDMMEEFIKTQRA